MTGLGVNWVRDDYGEDVMRRLGIHSEFRDDIYVIAIDWEQSLANFARATCQADEEMVEQHVLGMIDQRPYRAPVFHLGGALKAKGGTGWPEWLARDRSLVVSDGIQRSAGFFSFAELNGRKREALLMSGHVMSEETTTDQIRMFEAERNNETSKPFSRDDRMRHALEALNNGDLLDAVAARFRIPLESLQYKARLVLLRREFDQAGIDATNLTDGHVEALGRCRDDRLRRRMADAIREGKMSNQDTREMVALVNKKRAEGTRLAAIQSQVRKCTTAKIQPTGRKATQKKKKGRIQLRLRFVKALFGLRDIVMNARDGTPMRYLADVGIDEHEHKEREEIASVYKDIHGSLGIALRIRSR